MVSVDDVGEEKKANLWQGAEGQLAGMHTDHKHHKEQDRIQVNKCSDSAKHQMDSN